MDGSIYKAENIEVTPSFVHVAGVSYPLANITSIRVVEDNKERMLGILLGLLGLLIVASAGTMSTGALLLGLAMIAGAALLVVYGLKWHLVITTGAAERQALTSRKKQVATSAGAAINVAISERDVHRR